MESTKIIVEIISEIINNVCDYRKNTDADEIVIGNVKDIDEELKSTDKETIEINNLKIEVTKSTDENRRSDNIVENVPCTSGTMPESSSDGPTPLTETAEEKKCIDRETLEINNLKVENTKSTDENRPKENIVENVHCSSGTKPKITTSLLDVKFYTDELLRRKGFQVQLHDNTRAVVNLTLTAGQFTYSQVSCKGLPPEMIENELVPLFESSGMVYRLLILLNRCITYVTYMSEDDAENAVKTLHHREIHGRRINVERIFPDVRLFVKPIPNIATKQQIFRAISSVTADLVKVILFDSYEQQGKIKGFCYIEYKNHNSALKAKQELSKTKLFGKSIICDWPNRKMFINSLTLYIHNIRPMLHTAYLRQLFSIYGEVREVDKNGNFVSILFRNPEDAKRAAREVDKKQLGGENLEITFNSFKPMNPQSRDRKTYDKSESYSARKDATAPGSSKDFSTLNPS